MAVTLRLDEELDAELAALARSEHPSKQQLVIKATREYANRTRWVARTSSNAERVISENERLVERLGE